MRIAAVQFTASSDKADNLERLRAQVKAAAAEGAELVVTPEASMHGFGKPTDPLAPIAETIDGPFVSGLAGAAREHGVAVVAGMFELVPGDSAHAYNTVVAVGADGSLLGRYRKLHLFDALGWVESDRLARSPVEPLTFASGDFTVGVITCYDLRFPELARALVDKGATMLVVPAAWVAGPHKVEHWLALLTARAIENTLYVVAAGQGPPEYSGNSAVIDPFGVVVARLEDDQANVVADVSASRVQEVRGRMPSLQHRRFRIVPDDA
ncbi:MAG: carbon-nitrogen hydrolase family protein [Actinomycetes bacterium]